MARQLVSQATPGARKEHAFLHRTGTGPDTARRQTRSGWNPNPKRLLTPTRPRFPIWLPQVADARSKVLPLSGATRAQGSDLHSEMQCSGPLFSHLFDSLVGNKMISKIPPLGLQRAPSCPPPSLDGVGRLTPISHNLGRVIWEAERRNPQHPRQILGGCLLLRGVEGPRPSPGSSGSGGRCPGLPPVPTACRGRQAQDWGLALRAAAALAWRSFGLALRGCGAASR